MGLHLVDIYRSPNIGIFLKANDKAILLPKGIAASKAEKLAADLDVIACHTSIGGTRLMGPLVAMNNRGVLASRMIEDYEMSEISSKTGLKVERFQSRFTAVGNLVAANVYCTGRGRPDVNRFLIKFWRRGAQSAMPFVENRRPPACRKP